LDVFRLTVTNAGAPTYVRAFKLGADVVTVDGASAGFAVTNGASIGGTISPTGAALAQAATNIARSHIVYGAECMPDLENLGGAFGPAAKVLPGRAVTPNGIALEWDSTKVADANDNVNAAVVSFGAAGADDFFVFVTHNGGDRTDVLVKWSLLPPDAQGRPTGTITTNTADDYCYVGMLRFQDNSAGDWSAVWGDLTISNPSVGVREILFHSADSGTLGAQAASNNRANASSADASLGPATAPATTFPTARQVIFGITLIAAGDTGNTGGFEVTARSGGVYMIAAGEDEGRGSDSVIVRLPNRDEQVKVHTSTSGGYTGTVDLDIYGRIIGVVENVNDPGLELQTEYGFG
jgi:hypothetical protein